MRHVGGASKTYKLVSYDFVSICTLGLSMAGKYVFNTVLIFGALSFRVLSELHCSPSETKLVQVDTEFYKGAYIKIAHRESK